MSHLPLFRSRASRDLRYTAIDEFLNECIAMNESENPYAAPHAELREPPRKAGSPFVAVLAGFATDTAGTFACGIVLTFVHAAWMIRSGATNDSIAALAPSPALSAANMIVGTAWSVFGGYVCARIAKRRELTLGALQGMLSMLFGLWLSARAEWLVDLLLAVATVAAVVAGSAIGRRANARRG